MTFISLSELQDKPKAEKDKKFNSPLKISLSLAFPLILSLDLG